VNRGKRGSLPADGRSIGHVLAAHSEGHGLVRKVGLKLLTNPLILACLAGLAWNQPAAARGPGLPLILDRSLGLLGVPALPIALLCVGCGLADTRSIDATIPSGVAVMLKNVLAILLVIFLARQFKAGPIETGVALILMAAPTAIASFILAEELNGDPELAASTITLSTLLSLITLSAAVSLAL